MSEEDMVGWRKQTNGPFALRMFPGGHFFLHSAREPLLRAIAENLLDTIARSQRDEDYVDRRQCAWSAQSFSSAPGYAATLVVEGEAGRFTYQRVLEWEASLSLDEAVYAP